MSESIKLPEGLVEDLRKFNIKVLQEADRQETEFFAPYILQNVKPKIRGVVTEKKLVKRGVKRMFNPDTLESWMEQRGVVISPSFIRDPMAIVKSIQNE